MSEELRAAIETAVTAAGAMYQRQLEEANQQVAQLRVENDSLRKERDHYKGVIETIVKFKIVIDWNK